MTETFPKKKFSFIFFLKILSGVESQIKSSGYFCHH